MVTMMESMRLSPVAYLQQEETAVSKSEYLAGELFPIAGSTANHNRIAVSVYRSLPTLQDYVLIDQYRVHVDAYHKLANGQWLLTEYTSVDDVITLESVNVEIPVGQLYRRVDWSLR